MLHNSRFGEKMFAKYLEPGEKIRYIGHNHVLILLRDGFLFLLIGVIISYGLWFSSPDLWPVSILLFILSLFRFSYKSSLWYFDSWLITNTGIIDIEWKGYFNRKIIRISYEHFEGISTQVVGVLNTFIRLGQVTLVRNKDNHPIVLRRAYHPEHIESEVIRAQQSHAEESQRVTTEKHEAIKELLSEMIADYAQRSGREIDLS